MKNYNIEFFNIQKAEDKELHEFHDFYSEIIRECMPDDPPRDYDKFKQHMLNPSRSIELRRWIIRNENMILAYALLMLQKEGENKHIADVDIYVRKPWRKKGMGWQLLAKLYDEAVKENCSMLEFGTFSTVPDGAGFLNRIKAKLGSTEHVNELILKDMDLDLMDDWIRKTEERAADYELELWIDEYPENRLKDFAVLYNDFWNSIPMDDLEYEYENHSPERILNGLNACLKRGWKSWMYVAIHKPSDKPVGFTHVVYTGFNEKMLNQDDTGVLKEHRNKGLGRWMKAAMIQLIRKELPQIEKIRSENATSNDPMLKINFAMGFKPVYSESYWQIKTDRVKEYLSDKSGDER
jgi:GNAT superfamily N-acetyltransferase